MKRTLVLENGIVVGGRVCYRELSLTDDGTLRIEGQDLGGGEYEFARTVPPESVAALRVTLALPDAVPLLEALAHHFQPPIGMTHRLEIAIAEAGIESQFWSRYGE